MLLMLTMFPESVRQLLKLYDANGLRHHIAHLNDNMMRKRLACATIELQCEYVDVITRRAFPKNPEKQKPYIPQYVPLFGLPVSVDTGFAPPPIIPGPVEQEMDMTKINTTSIGNIAWVSLYHPIEEHRDFSKQRLQEIREYFIGML